MQEQELHYGGGALPEKVKVSPFSKRGASPSLCNLDGSNVADPNYSPGTSLNRFRDYLLREAPGAVTVFFSPDGGATERKTQFLRALYEGLVDEVYHLMCYALHDERDHLTLLNCLKPAFGLNGSSPFLHVADNNHFVLDRNKLRGFRKVDGLEFTQVTGANPHCLNFLFPIEQGVQILVDPHIFSTYLNSDPNQPVLIEVPVGVLGENYSVIIPVESLLAFLLDEKANGNKMNVQNFMEQASEAIVDSLADSLESQNLKVGIDSCYKFNPKAPLLSGFTKMAIAIDSHVKKFNPEIPDSFRRRLGQNFVRHFMAVEYKLISDALNSVIDNRADDDSLRGVCQRLQQTEYGRYFAPLGTAEEFIAYIRQQKTAKQPSIAFSFTEETVKSSEYHKWLRSIGRVLPSVVRNTVAAKDYQAKNFGAALEKEVIAACARLQFEGQDAASYQSLARDTVDLIFGTHQKLITRLAAKINAIRDPKSSYWQDHFRQNPGNDDVVAKSGIMQSLTASDYSILRRLPFGNLLFPAAEHRQLVIALSV